MAKQDSQDLIQNWMQQQQDLWKNWAESMQRYSAPGQDSGGALEQWRQAVAHTLETQKSTMHAWGEQIAEVEGAPDEVKRLAREGVQLLEQWSDTQRGMWQQWFDLMEGAGAAGGDPAKQMMAGWEQMSAQRLELQRQWLKSVGAAGDK